MMDKFDLSCLIGLLLLTTVDLRWIRHGHAVPPRSDFARFPTQVNDWTGRDMPDLAASVKRVLAADNYLFRDYHNGRANTEVGLFIAYYGSQRSGDALHSPKNCLPGAGWEPVSSGSRRFRILAAPGASFEANHYVIEKNGVQQDVLYWYQAHGRIFAAEYLGKFIWRGTESRRAVPMGL